MQILLKTPIDNDMQSTFEMFNVDLFEYLKPPLVALTIVRFDGCRTGDEFHLHLGVGPLKQIWKGRITEDQCRENFCYFIDEGIQLPAPLKTWKHLHKVEKVDNQRCLIIDDINYSTGSEILDYLIYPVMYLQFRARSPAYKKFLNRTR